MKFSSDRQRKAMFANLTRGGTFSHLKGIVKVKQLEKVMEEPVLFQKKGSKNSLSVTPDMMIQNRALFGPSNTQLMLMDMM